MLKMIFQNINARSYQTFSRKQHQNKAYLAKDPCVDSLLHHDRGTLRLVLLPKAQEAPLQLLHLVVRQHVQLPIADTVTEHNDLLWQDVVVLKLFVHTK